jgi:hypothetical protein
VQHAAGNGVADVDEGDQDTAPGQAPESASSHPLDDFSRQPELIQALNAINQHAADPSVFLQRSEPISHAARQAVKVSTIWCGAEHNVVAVGSSTTFPSPVYWITCMVCLKHLAAKDMS